MSKLTDARMASLSDKIYSPTEEPKKVKKEKVVESPKLKGKKYGKKEK